MGAPPQAIINDQLVDAADIVIGMFWTRLGTPTGEAESGTVEEIERLIKLGRRASILFCKAATDPYTIDQEQFKQVQAYRTKCEPRGLLAEFATADDLRDQLIRALSRHVEELQQSRGSEGTLGAPGESASATEIALAARPALTKKSRDENGVSWYTLVRQGKYEEGMQALEKSPRPDPPPLGALIDDEPFARLIAYAEGGVYRAFTDLEAGALASRESLETWFWYAVALEHHERLDESLAAMQHVADNASPPLRTAAVNWLGSTLVSHSQPEKALKVWRDILAKETDPQLRARLIHRVADAYEKNEAIKNLPRTEALREYALDVYPVDMEERLSVAYKYGVEEKFHALGLYHYQELLYRDAANQTALVNSGWLADRLSLPINAIDRYRQAEKHAESLAVANMGWKLLEAGFAAEAERMVSLAREMNGAADQTDSTGQTDKLAVAITERREAEATKWKTTSDKLDKIRHWRIKIAKGFLQDGPPATALSGNYSGSPSSLQISANADGTISATFTHSNGGIAICTGRLEGRVLTLDWSTLPDTSGGKLRSTLLSASTTLTGHGHFVVTDAGLQGYTALGSERVDPLEMDQVTEWELHRSLD